MIACLTRGSEAGGTLINAQNQYIPVGTYTPKSIKIAGVIDKVSCVLFPVLFIVFNVVYWCVFAGRRAMD